MDSASTQPDFGSVRAAQARIAPHALRTPVLRSDELDELSGAQLWFKCENLQRAGAFKFRGACNAVWSLSDAEAARGVLTHSSGNHGAALALAARTRGIAAHVVVPEGAVGSKLANIKQYGATLYRCAPTLAAREAEAARLGGETGAEFVHPYTDARVIAGQGTATLELVEQAGALDALITPVGGGGLVCGSALAAHGLDPGMRIFGAEPAGADDAARSLAAGSRVAHLVPDTVCDGLRGLLGAVNFELMRAHGVEVLTVPDADTLAAQQLLMGQLKLVLEPSSAIVFAALMANRERFRGQRVGLLLSGGNIELSALFRG